MDKIDYAQADKEQLEKFLEENPEPLSIEERMSFLRDDVLAVNRDLQEVLTILRPLAPFMESLPELMEKIDPLLEGLKNSPVLKMLGVKF